MGDDDSHVEKKLDPILVPEMIMQNEEMIENTDDDHHYKPLDGTKERKSILKQDGKSSSEGAITMKKKPSVTKRIKKSLSLKKLKKSLSSNSSSSTNKNLDYNPASSSSLLFEDNQNKTLKKKESITKRMKKSLSKRLKSKSEN